MAATDSAYGLALMALYLVADGMTSTTQERMFRGYTMSTYNQMLFTNLFSAAMSIVGTAVLPPPPRVLVLAGADAAAEGGRRIRATVLWRVAVCYTQC